MGRDAPDVLISICVAGKFEEEKTYKSQTTKNDGEEI
jgi:hypothetical protein